MVLSTTPSVMIRYQVNEHFVYIGPPETSNRFGPLRVNFAGQTPNMTATEQHAEVVLEMLVHATRAPCS
jgi:hypothetical protein